MFECLLEWERISGNYISDKGLVVRKYKELLQLNNNNNNKPLKKWGKDLTRHLSKEDIWKINKNIYLRSKSLVERHKSKHNELAHHMQLGYYNFFVKWRITGIDGDVGKFKL